MYLDNISIPLVFINAQDDPIIPEPLLSWPKNYAGKLSKQKLQVLLYRYFLTCIFVLQQIAIGPPSF